MREEEAILIIKNNRNPDVAVGGALHHRDLEGMSYKDGIRFFNDRIRDRYFNIAAQLASRKKHKSGDIFVVMILDCIIIDFLSQYRFGLATSSRNKFIDFFVEYLSDYNLAIEPHIESCSCKDGLWKSEKIQNVASAIYYGFRCSVLHSGTIREYGRINQRYNNVVKILPWSLDGCKRDINVNPVLLLKALKKAFRRYVDRLRYPKDDDLKTNFIKRFNYEYGIKLKG